MVGQRGNRGGGRGGGAWGDNSQDMGAMGGSMLGGYGTHTDTGMYGQGGKKRSYNESQDGYSNYYDTTSSDPSYRGMDPPSSQFSKTESTQQPDQYASYYENWDSGYYNQSNDSQSGYSDYGSNQQYSGGYNQSSNQDYSKNHQSWNKRDRGGGQGGGRGGGGRGQQQSWERGQGTGGGRRNDHGNEGGWMGRRDQQRPQKSFSRSMPGNKYGREGRGGNSQEHSQMSIEEKIKRFCQNIQGETVKVNAIQTLENALTGRNYKLGLKTECEVETLMHVTGGWIFIGCLKLDGIFLTRSVGAVKKEVKHDVYTKGLNILQTKTVDEIFALKDPGVEAIRSELTSILVAKNKSIEEEKKDGMDDIKKDGMEEEKKEGMEEIKKDDKEEEKKEGKEEIKKDGKEEIKKDGKEEQKKGGMLEVKTDSMGKAECLQVARQLIEEMTNTYSTKYDGFDELMTYLSETTNLPASPISCIEQGISASRCGFTHTYDCQMVRLPSGKQLHFRGSLTIAGVVVAVGTGNKKKDAKIQTYEQALEALRTKTMAQILKSVPEAEAVTEVVQEKVPTVPEKDRSSQTLLEKMTEITQLIKEAQSPENSITYLDITAAQLGFTPTCIFRKHEIEGSIKTMITCELYLDSILIATGEAERRKEAHMETYNSAWDVLCTTAPDYILKEHKRLKPGDQDDPNVMDVWVKSSGNPNANSNLPQLKRNKMDPNEAWKTVDVIVLKEQEDWSHNRFKQAFSILIYSCNFNGMLLEWQIEPDGNMFRSTIYLQRKMMGEASALARNSARNLAAACALFKLYETQHVIRTSKQDDTKLWVEYSDIEEKAEAMRVASGAPKVEVVATPDTEEGSEKPSVPANEWVVKVAEQMITQHIAKQTLDELIFGPGMPFSDSKEVQQIAQNLDLNYDIRQHEDQCYFVIHKRMTPQEMVKILQASNSKSGKYSLVDKSALPTYQHILPKLQKFETMKNSGDTQGTSKKIIKEEISSAVLS